jgi:N-acetylglucosaminyl-diphospho-decaprenol L-rhamnosyltransferase
VNETVAETAQPLEGTPPVTIAIINYNGGPFLRELLDSLASQTFRRFQCLLIDNGSRDGSPALAQSIAPWVEILPAGANLGFSRAGNLAARHSRSPYLVLLNTDIKAEPGWLAALLGVIGSHPGAAAVSSKMMLYDRPRILNGVGGCMNRLGYTWDRGMFEEDRGQYDRISEILFASAAAALFDRERFLEVGGFDERFFMYHEDVDLCWRLWLRGYEVLSAPDAVVHHHFGATTRHSRSLEWRERLGERNSIRSMLKNYEAANAIRAWGSLLFLRQSPRRKLAQLRNFAWNCGVIAETMRLRRTVQKSRVRSDREMSRLIEQRSDVPIRI